MQISQPYALHTRTALPTHLSIRDLDIWVSLGEKQHVRDRSAAGRRTDKEGRDAHGIDDVAAGALIEEKEHGRRLHRA